MRLIIFLCLFFFSLVAFGAPLTLEFSDQAVEDFAKSRKYTDTVQIEDGSRIPNPETYAEHTERILSGWIKNGARRYREEQAFKTARENIVTSDLE